MKFEDYDRVVDTLMYFTDSITLKFTVVMAKNMKSTNARRFFQYEVEKASKYPGGDPTRNINRNMTFFFSIDIKDEFGGGFVIKPGDAYMLLDMINRQVLPWYYSDSESNAFQYIKNVLALKDYKPKVYTQSDIKYLKFEPSVMNIGDGSFSYGCKISINGLHDIEITLEQLMEFIKYLNTDMYAVACNLVTYAKTPPYGVGLYRPYGLGGGHVEDTWGQESTDFTTENTNSSSNRSNRKGSNSFLDSI